MDKKRIANTAEFVALLIISLAVAIFLFWGIMTILFNFVSMAEGLVVKYPESEAAFHCMEDNPNKDIAGIWHCDTVNQSVRILYFADGTGIVETNDEGNFAKKTITYTYKNGIITITYPSGDKSSYNITFSEDGKVSTTESLQTGETDKWVRGVCN